MPSRRFIVHGRVQGVGFRAYVLSVAEDLGLVGEVWNQRDGNVELVAGHSDEAMLDELEFRLERGPGRVDRVSKEPESDGGYRDFRVGNSR